MIKSGVGKRIFGANSPDKAFSRSVDFLCVGLPCGVFLMFGGSYALLGEDLGI